VPFCMAGSTIIAIIRHSKLLHCVYAACLTDKGKPHWSPHVLSACELQQQQCILQDRCVPALYPSNMFVDCIPPRLALSPNALDRMCTKEVLMVLSRPHTARISCRIFLFMMPGKH
jgi:hypothetical protein